MTINLVFHFLPTQFLRSSKKRKIEDFNKTLEFDYKYLKMSMHNLKYILFNIKDSLNFKLSIISLKKKDLK